MKKLNNQELNDELDEDNDFDKDNSIDEFSPEEVFRKDIDDIDNDEFIEKKE